MKAFTRIIATAALTAGLHVQAATILVNFGDSAYTSDGSNTWQTFDLTVDGSPDGYQFDPLAATALVDTTGTATGYTFAVAENGDLGGGVGAGGGSEDELYPQSPSAGGVVESFSWFDNTVAEQRETYAMGPAGNGLTYTISGFNATDSVTFEFVIAREGSGTRDLDVVSSVNGTIVDDGATNSGGVTVSETLTGATSYSYDLIAETGGGFPASMNAMQINVTPIPEPGTLALVGIALGALLVFRRKR